MKTTNLFSPTLLLLVFSGCQLNQPIERGQSCCLNETKADGGISNNTEWAAAANWVESTAWSKCPEGLTKEHGCGLGLRVYGGMFGETDLPSGSTITIIDPAVEEGEEGHILGHHLVGSNSPMEAKMDVTDWELRPACGKPLQLVVEVRINEEMLVLSPLLNCSVCRESPNQMR